MAEAETKHTGGGWLAKRVRALRLFSLPVTVLPVLVVAAAVDVWDAGILTAAIAGVALLNVTGNMVNDIFDFRSGVDRRVHGDENRPGRLLVRGELSQRDYLKLVAVCSALAAGAGAYLAWRCGPGVLLFGAAGVLGLYVYTGPPFRLKYHALGELLIFILFGPVLVCGAAYALSGDLNWRVLLLSVPVGFATTAVLVGNNIRDRLEDAAAGIKTIAAIAGGKFAPALYVALEVGSVLVLAAMAAAGMLPPVVLAAPVLLLALAKPLKNIITGRRLPDIDARSAQFEGLMLIFLIAALVLG